MKIVTKFVLDGEKLSSVIRAEKRLGRTMAAIPKAGVP